MKKLLIVAATLLPLLANAQQTLSLDECRQMAITANKNLEQQRAKLEMAGYDRKIAAANYFPKISATATYQRTGGGFSLIDDRNLPQFAQAGAAVQGIYDAGVQQLMQYVGSNPNLAALVASNPEAQALIAQLSTADVGSAISQVGAKVDGAIDEAIHPDVKNLYLGVISVQQPLFVGGKIVASNKMAKYAEELARLEYEGDYDATLVEVDEAYWQVVSVANKLKLAESYSALLKNMLGNVELSVKEGVATEADALTVRVKSNEADLTLTRARNGLVLAKMLLCKQTGLPLDSEITLVDEELDAIPIPEDEPEKSLEEVLASRSETRRLDLAGKIYDQKVNVARADMLPTIALTANYAFTNPTFNHGFENEFGRNWAAGVLVSVPIFHGTEALQKTRKAKAEARIYRSKYEDAGHLIEMQVTQLRQQGREARERLAMSEANLGSAEENLRTATLGFEAGVVDANTALAAHTAWLQAHSACIDAGIELQLNNSRMKAALGNYTYETENE
ncbi:MAG: TolC family protein [Bacteroidales bacterium]|nr:TolC family protein [Bacteroidales bacterium]